MLDDVFDTPRRADRPDPEGEGRRPRAPWRNRGERLAEASIDHLLSQGQEPHADRLRRAAAGRCRRPGDLQEQAVQPGSAGGHRERAARRRRRRLLPGRERLQRLRRPSVHVGALLGAPGFTAATRGDVDTKTWAGVRRLHVRRDGPDQPFRGHSLHERQAPCGRAPPEPTSSAARPNSAAPPPSTRPGHSARSLVDHVELRRQPQGHGMDPALLGQLQAERAITTSTRAIRAASKAAASTLAASPSRPRTSTATSRLTGGGLRLHGFRSGDRRQL